MTREISTRSFPKKPHREVFFDAIYRHCPAENELVLNCLSGGTTDTFSRMGPAVRIPFAPATRHCEPPVPFAVLKRLCERIREGLREAFEGDSAGLEKQPRVGSKIPHVRG